MIRFTSNFVINGTTIFAGVTHKGKVIPNGVFFSIEGSPLLKDIPFSVIEEFEAPVLEKRAKKKIEPTTQSEKDLNSSARVSGRKDLI